MRITNAHIYLTIAEEALDFMEKSSAKNRRPKPNGEPGFIITYDHQRTSFKNALIAIIFAASYLEALFYLEGTKKVSEAEYSKNIDKKTYEEKLAWFEITDEQLLSTASRLRQARNDITHEKAKSDTRKEVLRYAQDEARIAVAFVKQIGPILQSNHS